MLRPLLNAKAFVHEFLTRKLCCCVQVVQRFQELFSQMKYKEAADLAAESPQGILRTPDTVAKFQVCHAYAFQYPYLSLTNLDDFKMVSLL